MGLYSGLINHKEKIAVVGLGYVGMPLAIEFSKKVRTIGFDTDKDKIESYIQGIGPIEHIDEDISNLKIDLTSDERKLREARFIAVAVPTPINKDKTPDLGYVIEACSIIGRNLSKGSIVVFESTVYPGVTEDICAPIIEKESGFICGKDFKIGYSPERINPGDKVNTLSSIVKIVSGMDDETLDTVTRVYELIIDAGVYAVGSIKVAEAAKLVENAQRDINIAFMNELAIVFDKMGINTGEVIGAMNTKWNALKFTPGLVGGHCIGIDPYYFIYEAEKLGYHSQIISAGRKINDSMGEFIGDITIRKLIKAEKLVKGSLVYVFGFTYKENSADVRNSKVIDIIKGLEEYGVGVKVVDPYLNKDEIKTEYKIEIIDIKEVKNADAIIFAVPHREFTNLGLDKLNSFFNNNSPSKKIIIDVKSIFNKNKMDKLGYLYWSL